MLFRSWDMAGGALLISEAGGIVSDLAGNQSYMASGHICAGNPHIHEQLLKLIAPHLTEGLKG